MNKCLVQDLKRSAALISLLIAASSLSAAEQVGPECRGVAAGVVAAMKSSGEIANQDAAQAAVIAARRACAAALEGGLEGSAETEVQTTTAAKQADDDDSSMWDFLTRDRNTKDGHDRLRRLKTQ